MNFSDPGVNNKPRGLFTSPGWHNPGVFFSCNFFCYFYNKIIHLVGCTMKIYLKWFYWYKNFWDEVLLFWLLNYLQKEYNPDEIVVEVWSVEWIQTWLNKNKEYLQSWIIDKLDFVENKEISKRFRQILSFFGINKYKKYFKVFGGWEVLDESRKFPHDGRNLALLHHYSIRKWKFILVWWIWTCEKFRTKKLFKYMLHRAQKVICREKASYERTISLWWKNAISYEDFSKEIFKDSSLPSEWQKKNKSNHNLYNDLNYLSKWWYLSGKRNYCK